MASGTDWSQRDLSRLSTDDAVRFLVDQQEQHVATLKGIIAGYNETTHALYAIVGILCGVLLSQKVISRDDLGLTLQRAAESMSDGEGKGQLSLFAKGIRDGDPSIAVGRPILRVIPGGLDD